MAEERSENISRADKNWATVKDTPEPTKSRTSLSGLTRWKSTIVTNRGRHGRHGHDAKRSGANRLGVVKISTI